MRKYYKEKPRVNPASVGMAVKFPEKEILEGIRKVNKIINAPRNITEEESDIMNLKEVAAYFRVHPVTLYRHLKAGKIPAAKIGDRWRFRKSMLDKTFEKK